MTNLLKALRRELRDKENMMVVIAIAMGRLKDSKQNHDKKLYTVASRMNKKIVEEIDALDRMIEDQKIVEKHFRSKGPGKQIRKNV